jgi:hypothetical protein
MPISNRPALIHKHVQDVAANEWTIVHHQGGYPIIDVFVHNGSVVQKILPASIQYIDEMTVKVVFSIPLTGFATVLV